MRSTFKNIILAGMLLGTLSSCTEDPNETKMQYFPDMADSPAIKTQGNYIDPPEGSIARTAILYPDTPDEAEKIFFNPLKGQANEAMHKENGKRLFLIYCEVCHGIDAKGDKGRIQDKYPRPVDLTLDMYKKRGDGFFFHRITHGSAVMPKYGHSTTPDERWEIIMHLRDLQNQVPAPSSEPSINGEKK